MHTADPDFNPEWSLSNPNVTDAGLVGLTWENFSENLKPDYSECAPTTDVYRHPNCVAVFCPLRKNLLCGNGKQSLRHVAPSQELTLLVLSLIP